MTSQRGKRRKNCLKLNGSRGQLVHNLTFLFEPLAIFNQRIHDLTEVVSFLAWKNLNVSVFMHVLNAREKESQYS